MDSSYKSQHGHIYALPYRSLLWFQASDIRSLNTTTTTVDNDVGVNKILFCGISFVRGISNVTDDDSDNYDGTQTYFPLLSVYPESPDAMHECDGLGHVSSLMCFLCRANQSQQ